MFLRMQRRYKADVEFKHERPYLVLIIHVQTTRQFGFPLDPLEDLNLCTSHFYTENSGDFDFC